MNHRRLTLVTTAALLAASASLSADVKIQERTSVQLGGTLGGLLNRLAGDAAKDGVVSTVAVHGTRKMTSNEQTGRIIDLSEEKVYDIDFRRKEYRVTTFAALRQQWQDAQAKAKKDLESAKAEDQPQDPSQSGREYEIVADVKDTGQTKSIAGHDARQVIVTLTMKEKGKPVEESGGLIMTNDLWIAPKVAELDEIAAFDLKFFEAVYGGAMPKVDAAQMSLLLASYPSFKRMADTMAAESRKLEGTPLSVSMTLEGVKSADEMKKLSSQPAPSGGGLAGRLAGRMLPKPKAVEQRSKALSSTNDTLSISASATDADVALPTGFKEKK